MLLDLRRIHIAPDNEKYDLRKNNDALWLDESRGYLVVHQNDYLCEPHVYRKYRVVEFDPTTPIS